MANSRAGRELATKLVRYYLPHPTPEDVDYSELDETCSLLLRHGTSYNRTEELFASEEWTSVEPAKSRLERRQENRERRMGELLRQLPAPDKGYTWRLRFEGLYASLECASVTDKNDVRSIPLSNY